MGLSGNMSVGTHSLAHGGKNFTRAAGRLVVFDEPAYLHNHWTETYHHLDSDLYTCLHAIAILTPPLIAPWRLGVLVFDKPPNSSSNP